MQPGLPRAKASWTLRRARVPRRERRGTAPRPGGEVIAGDISATMLDVARRNPENAGITFEPFDGHKLPYPDARFDRVICQLGLAFFDDPGLGLAEFRRVLKPSGRAAAIVNSPPERSLFTRFGTVIGQHVPERAEQLNRYASIRTIERLRDLFTGAAFRDVEVGADDPLVLVRLLR